MTRYGIRTEYDEGTAKTVPLTIWSGSFMGTWEARGTTRDGARRATFHDYSGEA
ncbi:hypothetical protein [Microbacterium sp. No. 7]|uniref:hypothetical protein n=1 Tax=Microbacterium sp. No. 7 TaxID=1714373 RepID=UPI0006ED33C7|nr:hypothetical protein [Microbacterium sp. No. 7]ALJ19526.1 hypothetical protein AOA12_06230 [Microbacterium sp. No. 7]